MARRFTDSEKWKGQFLRSLTYPYKLLWLYIQDECDHAGIWQVDIEVAQIKIGCTIQESVAKKFFEGKIIDKGTFWFIPEFIETQYTTLNPAIRAHESALKILEKNNLIDDIKELVNPLLRVKDKDKDKKGVPPPKVWRDTRKKLGGRV